MSHQTDEIAQQKRDRVEASKASAAWERNKIESRKAATIAAQTHELVELRLVLERLVSHLDRLGVSE